MASTQTGTRLEVTEYRLRLSRAVQPGEIPRLRGFFGHEFAEQVLLHHHREDGTLVYDYPRVQFKVLDRTAVLIGLAQGSDLLLDLWTEVERARIGEEALAVLEAGIVRRVEWLGETEEPLCYRFLLPWLALNQDNYHRYVQAAADEERQALLARTLVGNCLSLAKSFGHRVDARLQADCSRLREVPVTLKDVPMVGFLGEFRVNFRLPAHAGIGKSVARGFGTVEPGPSERFAMGGGW